MKCINTPEFTEYELNEQMKCINTLELGKSRRRA